MFYYFIEIDIHFLNPASKYTCAAVVVFYSCAIPEDSGGDSSDVVTVFYSCADS